jgi:hypothetical protein
MDDRVRFAIRFDAWYRVLSSALFLSPSASFVEIEGNQVHAKMGWGFRTTFPCSAVASSCLMQGGLVLSRGVHGMGGRWLVNGSGRGIVVIDLQPAQRAYVLGIPVCLNQLMVSLEDPIGLLRELGR